MDYINRLFAQLVGKSANMRYWKSQDGKYAFAYTTQRATRDGKSGFWVLKYRVHKDKARTWKLKRAVRFGRRKVAKARALTMCESYNKRKAICE